MEWREGSATMYKKDDIKVVLICSTDYLSISLTEWVSSTCAIVNQNGKRKANNRYLC